MLTVTCFGGVGEIGGNKVMLEDGAPPLMLDFGKSFGLEGSFFDEFLTPRTNSCLRDLLTLGILPPIDGIYRHDLLTHCGAWERLKNGRLPPYARRLFECDVTSYQEYVQTRDPRLSGVLLSHGHADHCQYISFLDAHVPIYASAATKAVLEAAQQVGNGGYAGDLTQCPTRSLGAYGSTAAFPGEPKIDKDPTPQGRLIHAMEPLRPTAIGAYTVTPIPVDHSLPGATAFLIQTPSGANVLYTGDLRFHGRPPASPEELARRIRSMAPGNRIHLVISEGTRVAPPNPEAAATRTPDDEASVEAAIREAMEGCRGLALVDFGWKDTTRLRTVLNAATAAGRVLLVNPKVAYLLELLRAADPQTVDGIEFGQWMRVYLKRTESLTYSLGDYTASKHFLGTETNWPGGPKGMREAWQSGDSSYTAPRLCHYYGAVRAYDVAEEPQRYVLQAGYFDMNELFDLNPPSGSVYISATTEPFCEEMALDERKLKNWLGRFGIAGVGDDGSLAHQHVSGHARREHLMEFLAALKPDRVMPIHTEHPELFEQDPPAKSEVILPAPGVPIALR